MTLKNSKIILFTVLIAAMILPFSGMNFATAEKDNTNPRDKTLERIQEKDARKVVLTKINTLYSEKYDLEIKVKSEKSSSEKTKINKRINEIKSHMDEIDRENHKRDIPQAQLEKLINQQDAFEEKLLNSNVVEFVTSIGIDITSKEIQVGLNQDIVNSENIDSIVAALEQMMPKNAKWHTVYSDKVKLLSCTNQMECDPIIGGNYIKVSGMDSCSFGFQAQKESVFGWITAGHCTDGKVGSDVLDHSGDIIGTVNAENFYWGTYCDCAWITNSPTNLVDNKVFTGGVFTITKTTPASSQQNDTILKSGFNGVKHGIVSAIHVTVLDAWEKYYVRDLVRSNTPMEPGDSGGTIVGFSEQDNLYGIVTADDWWGQYHTPIDRITADMNISPVLN